MHPAGTADGTQFDRSTGAETRHGRFHEERVPGPPDVPVVQVEDVPVAQAEDAPVVPAVSAADGFVALALAEFAVPETAELAAVSPARELGPESVPAATG